MIIQHVWVASFYCEVFSIISFTVSSAVVLLSAYLQSHLLIGLDKSLDCWCCPLTCRRNDHEFEHPLSEWENHRKTTNHQKT